MIHDLGIIMLTAAVISLVCKYLKQPVVLGYIVAGLLVGPYVCGSAWVHEEESVETWGQVGACPLDSVFIFSRILTPEQEQLLQKSLGGIQGRVDFDFDRTVSLLFDDAEKLEFAQVVSLGPETVFLDGIA